MAGEKLSRLEEWQTWRVRNPTRGAALSFEAGYEIGAASVRAERISCTEADRKVLEACDELDRITILQIHGIDHELGNALLARRGGTHA